MRPHGLGWVAAASAFMTGALGLTPASAQTPVPTPSAPAPVQSPVAPDPPTIPGPGAHRPDPPSRPPAPDISIDRSAARPSGPPADRKAPGAGGSIPAPTPDPTPVDTVWWDVGYRTPGTYTTTSLMAMVDRLEPRRGDASAHLSAPFIIAGRAHWWDSWGEVRQGADGLRPHLGQDVFCDYGGPVLAAEDGTIGFGSDRTGGLVARLYRGDGGYWYYAHLSGFAPALSSGARVEAGDVIGYCGNSGNAAGSPPHVHFGSYRFGVATNPMTSLVGWLEEAEANAAHLIDSSISGGGPAARGPTRPGALHKHPRGPRRCLSTHVEMWDFLALVGLRTPS